MISNESERSGVVVSVDEYGDNYTIKIFKTSGNMYYSSTVYEDDVVAECIYYGPYVSSGMKARQAAVAAAKRDEKARGKKDDDLLLGN